MNFGTFGVFAGVMEAEADDRRREEIARFARGQTMPPGRRLVKEWPGHMGQFRAAVVLFNAPGPIWEGDGIPTWPRSKLVEILGECKRFS